jgi:hypothetical protein
MNTYKYKIGDAFALKGMSVADVSLSIVVYSNTNTLVTFESQVAIKDGRTVPAFALIKYDLNSKEELDKLSDLELYPLPISKYGVSGSEVVYGEDTYMLIGATQMNIGYMTFIKPLLINLNRVIEFAEEAVINGDSSYQMTKDIDLLISQNKDIVKIPLESDKNLIIYESREASMPIKKIDKIEVSVSNSGDNNSDYLKTPYNSDDASYADYESSFDPFSILIGINFFQYTRFDSHLGSIVFSFLVKRYEKSSLLSVMGGELFPFNNKINRVSNVTNFIGDGDFMYPDWFFKIDNKIQFGSILSNSKGQSFKFLSKMVEFEQPNDYVPKFLKITPDNTEKSLIFHPEIFQGGNVKYKENPNDVFLTVANQILVGTKSYGFNSIFDKELGSKNFPLFKRSQLKGVITPVSLIKQKNVNDYFNLGARFKVTYLTDDFLQKLPESERESYPNTFYRELSQSDGGVKERDLIKYFDSKRLSELEESNPLIAGKINELISKSIKLYSNSITSTSSKSANFKDGVEIINNSFRFEVFDGRFANDENYYLLEALDSSFKAKKLAIERGDLVGFINMFNDNTLHELNPTQLNQTDTRLILPINEFKKFIFNWINIYQNVLKDFAYESKKYNIDIRGGFNEDFKILSNYLIPYKFKLNLEVKIHNYIDSWRGKNIYLYFKDIMSIELGVKNDDYPIEKIDLVKVQTNSIAQSCLESFDVFYKLQNLLSILPVLEYYNIVDEANIDDLKYDIRYRQWLNNARIFGVLTRKDVSRYDQFLSSVNNFFEEMMNILPDFIITTLNFDTKISWDNWRNILGDKENKDVQQYLFDKRDEISKYYGKLSGSVGASSAVTLLSNEYIDMLNILLDRIEATPHIGELFKGETTPSEQLLSIWGANDSNTIETEPISIEDENSLTLSNEEEPKVVVETVDPVNIDDEIDWDSLDVDDIDILLSDDSFDDIEI